MSELRAVYANALYDLWLEGGASGDGLEQAEFLLKTFEDEEFRQFVLSPRISATEKHEFLRRVFSGNISDDLLGFLCLAVSKDRGHFIVPALETFAEMVNKREGKITAKVLSATELSDAQIASLKDTLEKKLRKTVDLEFETDPSVIGGVYVYADGYFMDLTIKKRFRDMKREISGSVIL